MARATGTHQPPVSDHATYRCACDRKARHNAPGSAGCRAGWCAPRGCCSACRTGSSRGSGSPRTQTPGRQRSAWPSGGGPRRAPSRSSALAHDEKREDEQDAERERDPGSATDLAVLAEAGRGPQGHEDATWRPRKLVAERVVGVFGRRQAAAVRQEREDLRGPQPAPPMVRRIRAGSDQGRSEVGASGGARGVGRLAGPRATCLAALGVHLVDHLEGIKVVDS